MNIIWTKHAQERLAQWQQKLKILKQDIENIVLNPQQIVEGDLGTSVAQSKFENGLIRVVFTKDSGNLKVLTLYYTSKIDKYWKV